MFSTIDRNIENILSSNKHKLYERLEKKIKTFF